MTPLLGAKSPSAPVGDAPAGDGRAARSLLSCAWWRGIGRLWRGMGGRRPQRRQHGLLGFTSHETRTMLFPCPPATPRRATSSPTHGFSRNTRPESRNTAFMLFTRHETRLFFETRPFCRVGRQVMREGGQAHGLRGGIYEARENEWKGVFLNPETGITTYTESGFGSRFGIPHYSSVFVAKIRISPCRQSSAPAHCGNRDIGYMDASRPRLTFAGPQVSPSGGVKGERATNRETQAFDQARGASQPGFRGFHETRDTRHESRLFIETRL